MRSVGLHLGQYGQTLVLVNLVFVLERFGAKQLRVYLRYGSW